MSYWVNQGKTYKEEKSGGYLWDPIKNKNDQTFFYWTNITKLKPNDIVFNYRKGFIIGYCQIKSDCFFATQPKEFNVDVEWENEGYMVEADYVLLKAPLELKAFHESISEFLPKKYSPINKKIEGNQGYLFEINKNIASKLFELANVRFENPNKALNNKFKEHDLYYENPKETSKTNLTTLRIGQGAFRRKILKRWNYRCAVSKVSLTEILIASHIIPWREATNHERLDINNGLLLSPLYDALFDKYLISFNDDGGIIVSKHIKETEYCKLGITGKEKIDGLTIQNKEYLKSHRDKLYKI